MRKRNVIIASIFFIIVVYPQGSGFPEGYWLMLQQDTNIVQTNSLHYSEIEGAVFITGVSNLNEQNVCTSIGGNLQIGIDYIDLNPCLTHLSGRANVTSIGGNIGV